MAAAMTGHCEELLSVASASLAPAQISLGDALSRQWSMLGRQLGELLQARNGFYAFESALLVRPFSHEGLPLGLVQWNASDLWKKDYSVGLKDVLCFAEDVFGGQFCIAGGRVHDFNPETGEFTEVSSSLDGWCRYILENYRTRTGYPLAHAWQVKNGPLAMGQRLLPKVPFVLGGQYSLDNLYALSDVQGMLYRASIANQVKNVPDGSSVRLKVVD